MSTQMRYGVQFQPLTGKIDAGTVRRIIGHPKFGDHDVFIMKDDVTGHAIGAVALWLIAHADELPYQITDRNGTTYELTSRIVPTGERIGIDESV